MFKWWYTLHGIHKFSFFKQAIYIDLMLNVFFLYAFFFTPFAFFISSFFVFTEYIFALKPTNSSIIFPFNSSSFYQLLFCFHHHRMDFLSHTQKNWTNTYQQKGLRTCYSFELDTWGICISKKQRWVWVLSLDVTVVEIIHHRLQKIQGCESDRDRSIQPSLTFSSFHSHQV